MKFTVTERTLLLCAKSFLALIGSSLAVRRQVARSPARGSSNQKPLVELLAVRAGAHVMSPPGLPGLSTGVRVRKPRRPLRVAKTSAMFTGRLTWTRT